MGLGSVQRERRFRFADFAAFLIFFRAAAFCFDVAINPPQVLF
jgi:hypothetical protein